MRYCLKIAKFLVPNLYLAPPLGVTQSKFCSRVSCRKTIMMGLPGDEKCFMVYLAVSIQQTNVTDRRTDTRTPHVSKDRAMHSFARWKCISWIQGGQAGPSLVMMVSTYVRSELLNYSVPTSCELLSLREMRWRCQRNASMHVQPAHVVNTTTA